MTTPTSTPLNAADHRPSGAVVKVAPSGTQGLLAVSFEGPAVAGMLARYAGIMTLCDLDIVWASIVPLPSGAIRHEFEASPLAESDPQLVAGTLARLVGQAEEGVLDIASRLRSVPRPSCAHESEPVDATVDLDSRITTGLRIKAPDRPGLLHDIALTISSFGYRTRSITVLTSGGIARDTFRIVDGAGDAPSDLVRLESLRIRLTIACR